MTLESKFNEGDTLWYVSSTNELRNAVVTEIDLVQFKTPMFRYHFSDGVTLLECDVWANADAAYQAYKAHFEGLLRKIFNR